MSERHPPAPLFPPVEVSAAAPTAGHVHHERVEPENTRLLRDILVAQDRQNELLEELVSHLASNHRQRTQEMANWKSSNPELSQKCRTAAETLGRVQTAFLEALADEVAATGDALADGEFMLGEFVDRFGPRLAHLNGILQVLAQLSSNDD